MECHYATTGQEILRQIQEHTSNPIDAFVAGVGTGGTLIGIAKALKELYSNVHIAAIEPTESAVMSGRKPAVHGIPGIGDGFIPAIVKGRNQHIHKLINEIICVSSKHAINTAQRIYEDHGLCIGISSGANYLAARKLSKRFRTVVTIFPDGYSSYESMGLRRDRKRRCLYEKHRVNVLSRSNCDCFIEY